MKKILIAGGAGFIGYHIADYLKENYRITLIDNFSRGKFDKDFKILIKHKNLELKKYDLLNKISLKKNFNFIINLAAILGVEKVIRNPEKVLTNNILIQKNLIDFSKKNKNLEKFIFFSTSEVYAGSVKNKLVKFPTPENSILSLLPLENQRSTYMLSKIYGEAMTIHSGLPFIVIRPHNIYGPRMGFAHVIPQLAEKIFYKNKKLIVYNSNHKRTFFFIKDLVLIMRELLRKKKIKNKIFNIGSAADELTIFNLCKKIMNILKIKKKIIKKSIKNSSPTRRIPETKFIKKNLNLKKNTNLIKGIELTLKWYVEKFNEKN